MGFDLKSNVFSAIIRHRNRTSQVKLVGSVTQNQARSLLLCVDVLLAIKLTTYLSCYFISEKYILFYIHFLYTKSVFIAHPRTTFYNDWFYRSNGKKARVRRRPPIIISRKVAHPKWGRNSLHYGHSIRWQQPQKSTNTNDAYEGWVPFISVIETR